MLRTAIEASKVAGSAPSFHAAKEGDLPLSIAAVLRAPRIGLALVVVVPRRAFGLKRGTDARELNDLCNPFILCFLAWLNGANTVR